MLRFFFKALGAGEGEGEALASDLTALLREILVGDSETTGSTGKTTAALELFLVKAALAVFFAAPAISKNYQFN